MHRRSDLRASDAPDARFRDADAPEAKDVVGDDCDSEAKAAGLLETLQSVCWKAVAPSDDDNKTQIHRRQMLAFRSSDNDVLLAALQCLCIASGIAWTCEDSVQLQLERLRATATAATHPYAQSRYTAPVMRQLLTDFDDYSSKALQAMSHKIARASHAFHDAEQRFLAGFTLGNMYSTHPAWRLLGGARLHLSDTLLHKLSMRLCTSTNTAQACVARLQADTDALALAKIDALTTVHVPEPVGRAQIAARWQGWRRDAEHMLTIKACTDIINALKSIATAFPQCCMLSVLGLEKRMPQMARKIVREGKDAWADLFAQSVQVESKVVEPLKRALTSDVKQQDVFANEISTGLALLDELAATVGTTLNEGVCESLQTLLASFAQFPNLCNTNIAPVLNLLSAMHDASVERLEVVAAANRSFLEWLEQRVAACLKRAVKKKALRMLLVCQNGASTQLKLQADEIRMLELGEEHKNDEAALRQEIGKMAGAWSLLAAFESEQKQLVQYAANKAAGLNASTEQLLQMPVNKAKAVARGFAHAPHLLSDIVTAQSEDKKILNTQAVPMSVQEFARVAELLASASEQLSISAETPTDFVSCVETADLMTRRLQVVHEDMQQRNAVSLLYHGRFLAAVDAALFLLRPATVA